jgi:hypothetical protein
MAFDFTGAPRAEVFAEAERLRAEMVAEAMEAKSKAREAGRVWIPIASCGMPARTVRAAAHRGEVAVRRIGRADFIERADLDKWIGAQPRATAAPTVTPTAKMSPAKLAAAITDEMLASGKLRLIGGRQ